MPNTQRAGCGVLSGVDIAEPGAVAMGACQLRRHVPGALGHRWRERDRQKRTGEDHQPRDGGAAGADAGDVPGPNRTATARLRAAPEYLAGGCGGDRALASTTVARSSTCLCRWDPPRGPACPTHHQSKWSRPIHD
jgi:hypothetical protein